MGKGERVTVTKAKDLPKSGMMRLTERGNRTKSLLCRQCFS